MITMDNVVYGGRTLYGFDIGIVMLDTTFPRIIGDVGNAQTWNFPVLYEVVKDFPSSKVVLDLKADDITPFVEAAKRLAANGVRAITTSCGFLVMFQNILAQEIEIPVFTSTLLLIPLIKTIIGKYRKLLVLTANSDTLTEAHLSGAGITKHDDSLEILGTQHLQTFTNFTVQNWQAVNIDECRADLFEVLDNSLSLQNHEAGAVLLECTNMSPYSDAIRRRYKLPVFDFVSLTNFVYSSVCGRN